MDYKDVARNFGIMDRKTRAFVTLACERWHIGFSEFVLLEKLYENEGCSQEELAALVMSDKAIIARTVKILEDKGLVIRKQDKQDKRVKSIYLTSYAHSLEHKLDEVVKQWVDMLSEGVDPAIVDNVMRSLHIAAEQALAVDINHMKKIKGGNRDEK